MSAHGTKRGIPQVLIEVRQDLIAEAAGVGEWVERLAGVIGAVVNSASPLR
jgi:predicted N-formylglutamate amidohydrolase